MVMKKLDLEVCIFIGASPMYFVSINKLDKSKNY